MVPGLWPLVGTFYSPYHVSTMLRYVGDWLWSWFAVILTWWSGGLRGQLWPLASFDGSAWIFLKMHPNHPQKCPSHPILATGGCSILKSLFHWFHGSWPLASSWNFLFTLSCLRYVGDWLWSWFAVILTWWSGGLWGQLWPLASFDGFAWIFLNMHLNHPQKCNSHSIQATGGCSVLKSLFHWFYGSWPLVSNWNF